MIQQALSKVPNELKSLPCWLTWKFVPKEGSKPEKKPNVPPGLWDNKKLYCFDNVLKEYERCQRTDNKSRADGIGFAFLSSSDIVGIDIDNIPDEELKNNPAILSLLNIGKSSYIERSVSRKGFHLMGTCSNKSLLLSLFRQYNKGTGAKSPDGKLEMYAADHYFTMSGYTCYAGWGNIDLAIMIAWEYITGTPMLQSINTLQTHQKATQNAHTAPVTTNTTQTLNPDLKTQPGANPNAHFSESDKEILAMPGLSIETTIKKMYAANPVIENILKNGYAAAPSDWKVDGNADESKSGIDMKIAGTLCYWLKRYGIPAIVKVMSHSAIHREKHDRDDYLLRTVQTAYESAEKFYPAANYKKLSPEEKIKLNRWLESKKGA